MCEIGGEGQVKKIFVEKTRPSRGRVGSGFSKEQVLFRRWKNRERIMG